MFRIRLKELREKSGYSQYTFAKAFGVGQSTVANWESGNRETDFETLNRIADFFGVSIDYLIGRTNKPDRVLPKELEELGVEWIKLSKKCKQMKLTPEQVEQLIDVVKKMQ